MTTWKPGSGIGLAAALGVALVVALMVGFRPVVPALWRNVASVALARDALRPSVEQGHGAGEASRPALWRGFAEKDARITRGLGLAALLRGDRLAAYGALASYLETAPEDEAVRLLLGNIAYEVGDVELASLYWSTIPAGLSIAARAGNRFDAGDLDSAEQLMDLAWDVGPRGLGLAVRLAQQYRRLVGEYDRPGDAPRKGAACAKGREVHEAALFLDPSSALMRISMGALLRDCGKPSDAVAYLESVDTSYPAGSRAWALVELSSLYARLGDETGALDTLEEAVRLAPTNAGYRIMLASLRARLGRGEEALADLRVAAATENRSARGWAYVEMGLLHERAANLDAARESYERALREDATRDDARVLLAGVLRKLGRTEDGWELLLRAARSENRTWSAWAQRELKQLEDTSGAGRGNQRGGR